MYIRDFQEEWHSRTRATLAMIYDVLRTSSDTIPDIEFVLSTNDRCDPNDHLPLLCLARQSTPEEEHLWLMPDFGFWAWPEPKIGTYAEVIRKAEDFDASHPWSGKMAKLFWKGVPMVDVRKNLFEVAKQNTQWAQIEEVRWNQKETISTMDSHCAYKYLAHVEGYTYSGRLKYLLQCKSLVIAHDMQWVQHFHHLFNYEEFGSESQNLVVVPGSNWTTLPETMDRLMDNEALAQRLMTQQSVRSVDEPICLALADYAYVADTTSGPSISPLNPSAVTGSTSSTGLQKSNSTTSLWNTMTRRTNRSGKSATRSLRDGPVLMLRFFRHSATA